MLPQFLGMKIKSERYKEDSLGCTKLKEELKGPLFTPLRLASDSLIRSGGGNGSP